MENCKNVVILLAGGSGKRFGHKMPKQFVKVLGKTILEHTLDNINSISSIDEIYLVCHSDYIEKISELISQYAKIKKVVAGGDSRGESIKKGLEAISHYSDKTKVLVHDSVRPLIASAVIDKIIQMLDDYDVIQTVAKLNTDVIIENQFHHREGVKLCSGPEAGGLGIFKKAYQLHPCNSVLEACLSVTLKISTVESNPENIKVTYADDIAFVERNLNK
ncbi:MAG: 2-C-methyl-D-erythritol 4-phosphate cytidylyltransferase [Alphaproteobacteria bacterium]|nr:2-C-methyl-D-erythritol 4-phosphate cytidylyltransferase [Alphaproteobacteria bacterium]